MDQLYEWNRELQECKERQRLKAKRQRRLDELADELEKQRCFVEECRERSSDERDDVETLKSASIPHVWYRLLGRLERKLEQEEREAEEAALRLDSALAALAALEAEQAEAAKLYAEVEDAEAAFEAVLTKKKNWIRLFDADTERELDRLTEAIDRLKARQRETVEAEEAGARASDRLIKAQDKLRSARNWGTYDMLGGGMISTAIKHNRIDEARELMHRAQAALRAFERELGDIQRRTGAGDVEMGGFLTFADYFFDGFLTDWVVQGRINDALDKVDRGVEEVERQLTRLAAERERLDAEIGDAELRYRETIEKR